MALLYQNSFVGRTNTAQNKEIGGEGQEDHLEDKDGSQVRDSEFKNQLSA